MEEKACGFGVQMTQTGACYGLCWLFLLRQKNHLKKKKKMNKRAVKWD